ncbi:MAG: hypothetical protein HKN10_16410 [Myxococcales bacterium]|nr:hypothetical protein [Myxococcales bacterium]
MSDENRSGRMTSIPPENEAYASFLKRIDEISEWLRSGYSVKGVWIACTRSTPAFSGSYHTFWRYCRLHDLRVRRGMSPRASRDSPALLGAAPKVPQTRGASSQKTWPRLSGKPREFIPRTED